MKSNNKISLLRSFKRKPVSTNQAELITTEYFSPDHPLPLVIKPNVEGVDLLTWATNNRDSIEELLLKHGGILFRNFPVNTLEDFAHFISSTSDNPLEYREQSSPRSKVGENIYTSTDYPPDQAIFLHNESSYSQTWPLRIFFYCAKAAQEGGETPIANCRAIFSRIDPAIRDRFSQKKVMYVRNFGAGLGLPWQTVFQTNNKGQVEDYCHQAGIDVEWKSENRLCTRKVGPAALQHPQTGEWVWFNHATFFHVSTLAPSLRDALLAELSENDLPTNTYYGDGSPIEPEVLDSLRATYHEEAIAFPWQEKDILMLDNMLTAHARNPFVGERKVVVGMSRPQKEEQFG